MKSKSKKNAVKNSKKPVKTTKKKIVKPIKKDIKKVVKKPVKAVKNVVTKSVVKPKAVIKKEANSAVEQVKISPVIAYLGLGSNVGDREEYIEQAVFLIGKINGVSILKRSSNAETDPEGKEDQPSFINAVLEIKTSLHPLKLLEELQNVESALGREREVEWGPRTIDIDILMYGNLVMSDERLQIPHPLMHERLFVLQPLKEIAPRAVHPILEKPIATIYEERKNEMGNDKYDDELPGFKEIKKGGYDDYERW